MTDPTEDLALGDAVARPDLDAPRREVREERVGRGVPDDDVVPCEPAHDLGRGLEGQGVPDREEGLTDHMEPLPLLHIVDDGDDLARRHRVDRLPPAVDVARAAADQIRPERPGRVKVEPRSPVRHHEVERVPLAQDVGPVARDAVRRRGDGHPPTPEREGHRNGPVELAGPRGTRSLTRRLHRSPP